MTNAEVEFRSRPKGSVEKTAKPVKSDKPTRHEAKLVELIDKIPGGILDDVAEKQPSTRHPRAGKRSRPGGDERTMCWDRALQSRGCGCGGLCSSPAQPSNTTAQSASEWIRNTSASPQCSETDERSRIRMGLHMSQRGSVAKGYESLDSSF